MKRVVIISDMHCGHRAGLTPSGWQWPINNRDHERQTFARNQRTMWDWYLRKAKELKPVDYLFVDGDCIEGKGQRSGGTENVENDRKKQCEIAAECINVWEAKKIVMIYGTPYHNGVDEDLESIIADKVGAEKIGGHEWVDVEGLVFDLKHKISGSIIPHGRYTAMAREALWNAIWAQHDGQPKADVIIRSHVHYFVYMGTAGTLGIITPALQGWGSKFGVRECSGLVDIGFLSFDVEDKEHFTWHAHMLKPKVNAAREMLLTL